MIVFKTNMGDFTIDLFYDKAPKTCENFVQYVKNGHFDGTIFHRVIKGFMIQGGGLDEQMNQKETMAPIVNEADNGLKNEVGTIAMARTSDPDSATSQFFINTVDNDYLNFSSKTPQGWGYCVFGKVVDGLDVVKKIEAVKTHTVGFYRDVPESSVIIHSATLSE